MKIVKMMLCTRNPHIYPHALEGIRGVWYNFYKKRGQRKDCERGDDMWYSAIAIARYVITKCSKLGKPVSNLKLQKMLYFLWADFYRESRRYLFLDNVCAWQLGPVIPEVYYEYSSHAGRPIYRLYSSEINEEDEEILDRLIMKYLDKSASTLVSMTHRPGSAWDLIYQGGNGNRQIIPFNLIIEKEVR